MCKHQLFKNYFKLFTSHIFVMIFRHEPPLCKFQGFYGYVPNMFVYFFTLNRNVHGHDHEYTVDSRYLVPVRGQNSRARVTWFSQTRDFQDQSPTLWRLHLLNPNSMLSDNGCTYISWISADVDISLATNHNKPYYISIIMHQKLSNYMLHKAVYDGICAETIQTKMRFDRKRK